MSTAAAPVSFGAELHGPTPDAGPDLQSGTATLETLEGSNPMDGRIITVSMPADGITGATVVLANTACSGISGSDAENQFLGSKRWANVYGHRVADPT